MANIPPTNKSTVANSNGNLELTSLTAFVIGSMIGGGVFSLPQNMANGASPGAVIVGWLITVIGMLALALVYQRHSTRKPKLDAGPYAYARAEDRDTRARFGTEFDTYADRVPAFLPTLRAATRASP